MTRLPAVVAPTLIALVQATSVQSASAAPVDPAFTESVLLAPKGMAGTTAMAWAPDGSNRLFYTRQLGKVNVIENGGLRQFASTAVFTGSECGALGLAFDPNFEQNHFLYVFVTVSKVEQQIIRYVVDSAVGATGKDPTIIVAGLPTRGLNHNGGSIGFGPDGKLYWSIGDNGNGTGAGDDLTVLAAKVSRANPDGSVPTDNPFFDGAGPNDDRIWATGFRNPFTFTWQPGTDRLWVNSVGKNAEQIFTPRAGDNAGWTTYENNQPAPFIEPIVAYPTSGDGASTIIAGGAVRKGGVATFTTTAAHGLHSGGRVTLSGISTASFNGPAFVRDVPTTTTFSVVQAGPDAVGSDGSVIPLDLGNAITGGTFWDSSSVPETYRGNYFFGDYVSGNIARVTLDVDNRISSFDLWETTGAMIDMAVGPDGDLYYATFDGGFYRIAYNAAAQGIVVSNLHVRVAEGGRAGFNVRLARAPAAPITVSVARASGDTDVKTKESSLLFDATNWSVPQAVHVTADADDDAGDDAAELSLSASGLNAELVSVRVTDDDLSSMTGAAGAAGADGGLGGDATAPAGNGGVTAADGGAPTSAGTPGAAEGGESQAGLGGVGATSTEGPPNAGAGGDRASSNGDGNSDGGCGCRIAGPAAHVGALGWLMALLALRRRRARRPSLCQSR